MESVPVQKQQCGARATGSPTPQPRFRILALPPFCVTGSRAVSARRGTCCSIVSSKSPLAKGQGSQTHRAGQCKLHAQFGLLRPVLAHWAGPRPRAAFASRSGCWPAARPRRPQLPAPALVGASRLPGLVLESTLRRSALDYPISPGASPAEQLRRQLASAGSCAPSDFIGREDCRLHDLSGGTPPAGDHMALTALPDG